MAKKLGFKPAIILRDIIPEDETVDGGGTGQGTPDDAYPCDFEDWSVMFEGEYDGVEGITFDDYREWWKKMNFSAEDWEFYNGDTPL